jgi:hypothetical protein
MRTQDEAEEAVARAAARSHRVNQFFWGWSWAGVVSTGLKLVGAEPTDMSPWMCLFFFVLFAVMAMHFGKQVKRVGMTYKGKQL